MTTSPSFSQLIKNPIYLLAFGFGAGLSPLAPGTIGTLIAIPFFILVAQTSLLVYCVITALITLMGIWICGKAAEQLGVHDHRGIVFDEIAGFLITMIAVPLTWQNITLGFFIFRFFDIAKPWPISWADRHVKGGTGIMLDDIIAGVIACLVLHGVLFWLLK